MNPQHGRRRRKPVSPHLVPGSTRSLDTACRLADLPLPQNVDDLGETFLRLLIQGIDHLHVGQPVWFKAMLAAPRDRQAP